MLVLPQLVVLSDRDNDLTRSTFKHVISPRWWHHIPYKIIFHLKRYLYIKLGSLFVRFSRIHWKRHLYMSIKNAPVIKPTLYRICLIGEMCLPVAQKPWFHAGLRECRYEYSYHLWKSCVQRDTRLFLFSESIVRGTQKGKKRTALKKQYRKPLIHQKERCYQWQVSKRTTRRYLSALRPA